MWYFKGKKEPSTALVWFYPLSNGKYECRLYGKNGWQAITSDSASKDYLELKKALEDKVSKVEGYSLVSDAQIAKLTSYPSLDTLNAALNAISAHINNKENPHGVTKAQVGLGNVDNTSDANKPVSTAQQAALNNKVNTSTTVNGHALSSNVTISKSDVGLGSVDNTSDANKPISTAQQAALDGKADKGELLDVLSYGVEWDTSASTPNLTRVGNLALHKSLPIQSSLRGCIFKDGAVQYYLDPDDWTQKADGSGEANLDGTDGDVMVHHTRFYGKSIIDGTKRQVRISMFKIDDTWTEIPEGVVSAYRATTDTTSGTTKLRSVVNTTTAFRGGGNRSAYDTYLEDDPFRTDLGKPRTNISRANMRNYARNNGVEVLDYNAYKWVIYWLPVIEYATFHMQKAYNAELTADGMAQGGLGAGVTTWANNATGWSGYNATYPIVPCGYTNEFGNFSGVKNITIPQCTAQDGSSVVATKTMSVCRYRGIEQIFGDVWTNVDGVILKKDAAGGLRKVYTTSDPAKFSDSNYADMVLAGNTKSGSGWIKEFTLGETAEIIPEATAGGETTYKTDYYYDNDDLSNHTLLFGGAASNGGYAGLGSFFAHNGVGGAYSAIGCRTYKVIK